MQRSHLGHHGHAAVVVAVPGAGGAVIAARACAILVGIAVARSARGEPAPVATGPSEVPPAPSTTQSPTAQVPSTAQSPTAQSLSTAQVPTGPVPSTGPVRSTAPAQSTAQDAPPTAQGAPPGKPSDDDGEPRLSLPTQADRDAWQTGGFRLGLGLVYGQLAGLRGAPSGRLLGATVRVGLRLDQSWSLVASFQYALASQSGGLSGLRFAGTLDPTWHITPSLSVAFGLGFGGIVEGTTGRMDPAPLPGTLDTSYTFPSARTPVASCSGVGVAGLARIEWAYVLGPRTQTSVSLEVIGQWTGCVDDTNRVEPDTGTAIVRRQWWPHAGATLGWGIAWR